MVKGARHPARSLFAPRREPDCEEGAKPPHCAGDRGEVKNYACAGADQLACAAGDGCAAQERAPGAGRGELPKYVVESWRRGPHGNFRSSLRIADGYHAVFTLPGDLFNALENAATSHPPHRESDPSSRWGVDIFEDDEEYRRPHTH